MGCYNNYRNNSNDSSCCWIIILLLILWCCNNNSNRSGSNYGSDCGCNNGCMIMPRNNECCNFDNSSQNDCCCD